MSHETNTIWLENQEELKVEHNCDDNCPACTTLEKAVDQEIEEEEVNRLAHENCTPEDYS